MRSPTGSPLLPGTSPRVAPYSAPGRTVVLIALLMACLLLVGAYDNIAYIFERERRASGQSTSGVAPSPDGAVASERLTSDTRLASTLPGVLPPLPQTTERVQTQHLESLAAIERKKLDHGSPNSLSRSLLEPIAENGTVILTVGNSGRRDFLENVIRSLHRSGCKSLVIGAADDALFSWLQNNSVPAFKVDLGRDPGDTDTAHNLEWRGKTYKKLMKAKVYSILSVMRLGFSVLWTDSDVVWLRNPIPLLAKHPDYDVLASSDHFYGEALGEELEPAPEFSYWPNTGIALYRPSAEPLVLAWLECVSRGIDSDQPCLHMLIAHELKSAPNPEKRNAALVFFESIVMGTLPISYFVGGQMWLERYPQEKGVTDFYARHSTWQRCPEAKLHRLREDGFWLLDGPEWYDHPMGFISYDADIAQHLVEAAETAANPTASEQEERRQRLGEAWSHAHIEDKLPHLRLLNYQLSQLRNQLVLAAELGGAAAILPPFMCAHDKSSYELDGRIPGSHIKIPFNCPADMVLNFQTIHNDNPNGFREHSFLSREEARKLNATRLDVTICQVNETDCEEGDSAFILLGDARTMKIKPFRTLDQLRTLFTEPLRRHKLIHFKGDMSQLMAMTPAEVQKHSQDIQKYTMGVCCVHEAPHQIRYDLFWDVPGHYTASNEFINGTWTPKLESFAQCD